MSLPEEFQIRLAEDRDSIPAMELIKQSYHEYTDQGVIFDEAEHSDLLALATDFVINNGEVFVITNINTPNSIAGICGFTPLSQGSIELKKLYVSSDHRGNGLGQYLVDYIIGRAIALNVREIVLWTDIRFTKAHRLYEKRGFVRRTTTRILSDKSKSEEFRYQLNL